VARLKGPRLQDLERVRPPPLDLTESEIQKQRFFMEKATPRLVEWCCQGTKTNPRRPLKMKLSRSQVRRKTSTLPILRFEDQKLTSFSGLLLFHLLFSRLHLKERLRNCFRLLNSSRAYDLAVITLGLIVHLLLGFRQLRDVAYYQDDPMVLRVLGLNRLPDVATISRALASADSDSVASLRHLCRQLVLERLAFLGLRRVTLDFDGSVIGTGRRAEGSAVGFNRNKKGQRSYYPLFCTLAQSGQVFDVLHRPGNVHDSNGAADFLRACIERLREVLPGIQVEIRMDSAFFSDSLVRLLEELDVEFTISVPFERFVELKAMIEGQRRWQRLGRGRNYFELSWKPKSWEREHRFIVVRSQTVSRDPGPVQLDLFVPQVQGYDFKVVLTNKQISSRAVVDFHDGRGAQEGAFAELKSHGQLDYVPTRTLAGNQIFLLSAILAYNLNRELQMIAQPQSRATAPQRPPLWKFERLQTVRGKLIQRAGRFTQPQGRLTLTLSANRAVQEELLHYMAALQEAA
jgi:Transposase DDE domain group 1